MKNDFLIKQMEPSQLTVVKGNNNGIFIKENFFSK